MSMRPRPAPTSTQSYILGRSLRTLPSIKQDMLPFTRVLDPDLRFLREPAVDRSHYDARSGICADRTQRIRGGRRASSQIAPTPRTRSRATYRCAWSTRDTTLGAIDHGNSESAVLGPMPVDCTSRFSHERRARRISASGSSHSGHAAHSASVTIRGRSWTRTHRAKTVCPAGVSEPRSTHRQFSGSTLIAVIAICCMPHHNSVGE
jgi:hypothetical protein